MKKTLVMIFTVFVIGVTVFAVFAADNITEKNEQKILQSAETTLEPASDITTAAASSKSVIGIDAAKKKAADYVGVKAEDVKFTEKDIDFEIFGTAYELEFCYDGMKYECEVDAYSGDVIKCEKEHCDREHHFHGEYDFESKSYHHDEQYHSYKSTNENITESTAAEETTAKNKTASETEVPISSELEAPISSETAKQAVLVYAGVSEADAVFSEVSRDYSDGRYVYELSFCCNGTEYECEVDAYSGKVTEYEREFCDEHFNSHMRGRENSHH